MQAKRYNKKVLLVLYPPEQQPWIQQCPLHAIHVKLFIIRTQNATYKQKLKIVTKPKTC